jgi:hypothetical protein
MWRLLDVHRHEVLAAGDARNQVLVAHRLGRLANRGSSVLGTVGVHDLDGDVDLAHREDGLLLEDRGAHVGELAHLVKRDATDGAGVLDDPGICREEARDVRPVLIDVGIEAAGGDGARDVAAAALEELDGAVDGSAVEAGQHEGTVPVGEVLEARGGALHVHVAVMVNTMTSAASTNGSPRYSAMMLAVNHSPRETTYSGECFLMLAAKVSNFSATGHLTPSSSAMSTKRCSMSARSEVQSTWYSMCAFTRSRRSVILLSPEKRLPTAETTTKRRSGSDSTMDFTLRNWSAAATLEPPNLQILIM